MHLLLCITSCQITFYNNQSIIFNQDIFQHCKRIHFSFPFLSPNIPDILSNFKFYRLTNSIVHRTSRLYSTILLRGLQIRTAETSQVYISSVFYYSGSDGVANQNCLQSYVMEGVSYLR